MTSAILLSGGLGSRMQASVPKQFLRLGDQPIVTYSYDLFCQMDDIYEVVVVCSEEHRSLFCHPKTRFADPGARRQDSVYSGLLQCSGDIVCVHDGARPFITADVVRSAIHEARIVGAVAVGIPLTFTIKQKTDLGYVRQTPNRDDFWEIQTPQAIRRELLLEGFEWVSSRGLSVTDDVSIVELIEHPVKLVEGSPLNVKITRPEDMAKAEALLPHYLKRYEQTLQV